MTMPSAAGALVGGGVSRIADIVASTMHTHADPEFGAMQLDSNTGVLFLLPDSMPGVRLPPARTTNGGYVILHALDQDAYSCETEAVARTSTTVVGIYGTHDHSFLHTHQYPSAGLQDGDRVFVVWAAGGAVPVVVGTVTMGDAP